MDTGTSKPYYCIAVPVSEIHGYGYYIIIKVYTALFAHSLSPIYSHNYSTRIFHTQPRGGGSGGGGGGGSGGNGGDSGILMWIGLY